MVAFHYPPFSGGTGVDRTLKFSRYLPDYGWQPIVLTLTPHACPRQEAREIPAEVVTARALGFDTARHLSWRGAYPQCLAVPDRWMTWLPGALLKGARLIRQHRPDVIWSTYPIATAHMIGVALKRWSGIPWVADYRDPMVQFDPATGDNYPSAPLVRRAFGWIEEQTVKFSSRMVFTTPGTRSMYAHRFSNTPDERWAVIPNGYDEEDFEAAERETDARPSTARPVVLLHSGVLYPAERDPMCFFAALSELRRAGQVSSSTLRVILRATGHDDYYRSRLRTLEIEGIVSLEPPILRHDALVEMLRAHGLLIFQGSNCNQQIPAKAYECLRAGRPIFAMTDPSGDTAQLLRREGIQSIVPLDSKKDIASGLMTFLQAMQGSDSRRTVVNGHSRKDRTRELAALLESVCC